MNESRAVAAYLVNKYAESDKLYPKVYLTKMCIKSAPYLLQKSANWALNRVFFWCFGADVVYYINSSQIAPLEGAVPT